MTPSPEHLKAARAELSKLLPVGHGLDERQQNFIAHNLALLLASTVEREREVNAEACHEIGDEAERDAVKWHEVEGQHARRHEARNIHYSNGARACEKAIRSRASQEEP